MATSADQVASKPSTTVLQEAFTEASQVWISNGTNLKDEISNLRQQRETLKKAAKVKSKEMKAKRQKISRAKKHTSKVPTEDLLQLVAERLCHAQAKAEAEVVDPAASTTTAE